MAFQFDTVKRLARQGRDFAIFSLRYSLVPSTEFPEQLRQASSALYYLVNSQKRDPRCILLAGDSAGGNLVASLLLAHPLPTVAIPTIQLAYPLRAAILISPWVSFSTTSPAFKDNKHRDYVTAKALMTCAKAYSSSTDPGDAYTAPIHTGTESWTNVARHVASSIYIHAGGNEVLLDEITRFASMVNDGYDAASIQGESAGGFDIEKGGCRRVEVVVSPKEGHEEMIMDFSLFRGGKGASAKVWEGWLLESTT